MGWFDWFSSSPSTPPSPAKARAPAPATTSGAATNKPTQECPRNAKHPCDVNKLMIQVTGKGKEDEKVFKLDTTKVRRTEPVTDVKDHTALTLLKTYDLLIDVIANPQSGSNHKAKPAKIEGRAYYTSPDCETQSHSLLTLNPLGTRDQVIIKKIGGQEIEMAEHTFFARDSYIDHADKRKQVFDNAFSVFGIVKSFIESIFGFLAEVDLRADACGKRARGDGGNLNQMLLARTRIFRSSKWAIGIKIPPLGSFKAEKEKTLDVHGISTDKSSREATAGFNAYSNKTTSTSSGEGVLGTYKHTQERQLGGNVDSYESARKVKDGSVTTSFEEKHSKSDGRSMENTDGEITVDEIKERLHRESGFELVISIDDHEVEVGEGIKKIKELIEKISETIKDVRKLFDKVPQVGWKFTFEVSVFAGTLALECTPEYVEGVKANGRYYAVQHKFNGNIEMEIFSVTLSVSFGVEAKALDSGLVLKVEGKISLKCKISREINLDFFSPKQEFEVEASATAKLAVVGYVSLLGHTMADAELSVSSGLEFKGKFEVEIPTRKFDLHGKLKTKKILLTGWIRSDWWFDKKIDPPKELLPERELCEL